MRERITTDQTDFLDSISNHINDIRTDNPDLYETLLTPDVVECNHEKRSAVFELPVTEKTMNFSGAFYGGALASLFDNATGILMRCYSGRYESPTSELSVRFHRPAFIGDTVKVFAEITSITNSFVDLFAIAYIIDRNVPVATASARFYSKS